MSYPNERPRGILTPSDRELLRGEVDFEYRQQYSNRRQDIRQRITNGLIDFSDIQHLLRDRDRKRIFRNSDQEAGVAEVRLVESIRAMLYWTYLGLKEQNYDFEGILNEAIEDAELDYARKYWGKSVEVDVRFNVDVKRSHDIDDVIAQVENGGPIQANRLYNLVQISGGVPIDTSELDELRVWFQSSYPEGEKAVIESIFSEFLNVNVDIKDAVHRVNLTSDDLIEDNEGDMDTESAVVRTDQSRPEPSEIKNYSHSQASPSQEHEEELNMRPSDRRDSSKENTDNSNPDESVLEPTIDQLVENSEKTIPNIHQIIKEQETGNRDNQDEITPAQIKDLLGQIQEPFVSTEEIAAVFDCPTDIAHQYLLTLFKENKVNRRQVTDRDNNGLDIWWQVTE